MLIGAVLDLRQPQRAPRAALVFEGDAAGQAGFLQSLAERAAGEAGDPVLDAARLSADIEKVLTSCATAPSKNLMSAMKEALAG